PAATAACASADDARRTGLVRGRLRPSGGKLGRYTAPRVRLPLQPGLRAPDAKDALAAFRASQGLTGHPTAACRNGPPSPARGPLEVGALISCVRTAAMRVCRRS